MKISLDSAFSFWTIESKRKRGKSGISRKSNFRRRESDENHFFWKESVLKPFNFEKLAKIWGKRAFLEYWRSITRVQKILFRSLQVVHNTYDTTFNELFSMNRDVSIHQKHLRFLVNEVFKSVNNLNSHFIWDYFKMNFFP